MGIVSCCTWHFKMSPKIWYLNSLPEDMTQSSGAYDENEV